MTYGPQPPQGPQGPQLQGPPPGWQGQWPPPPPRPVRNRPRWPWIAGCGVLLLLLIAGIAGAPDSSTPRTVSLPAGTIEMPNYVGANTQAASNDLRSVLGQALSVVATGGAASGPYPVLSQVPAPGTPINVSSQIIFYTAAPTAGAASSSAPRSFTLRVEGSARSARVFYGVSGSSGGGDEVRLPWTTSLTDTAASFGYASISASTDPGAAGNLTCTITDESGTKLAEQSAASQGGSFGSASVMCGANRYN